MIVGQDRSGKTSLRKRLLGEKFNSSEPSTVGIEVNLVELTTDNARKPWKAKPNQRLLISKHVANEKISKEAANLLKSKDLPTEKKDRKDDDDDELSTSVQVSEEPSIELQDSPYPDPLHKKTYNVTEEMLPSDRALGQENVSIQRQNAENEIMEGTSFTVQTSTHGDAVEEEAETGQVNVPVEDTSSPIHLPNEEFRVSSRDSESEEMIDVENGGTSFKDKKLTESRINKIMQHTHSISNIERTPPVRVILSDFAGQSIYYDTHYLFLQCHCPYILVHDLTKVLDQPAQPRFKAEGIDVEQNLNNPLLATNLDYFLSWLKVLGQLRESANQQLLQEFPDFVPPPVLIVLTNEDRFEGDIQEVKRRIKEITDGSFQNVFPNVYVIDNTTTSGKEDPIIELRGQVFDLCQKILEKEPPMPMRWLNFEAALSSELFSKKKRNYISVDEAKKIAEKCNIESFDDAIRFLHRYGVVVYYTGSSVVVLNPSWLMNLFTEVITIPEESKPKDAPYYCELRTNGVLMPDILKRHRHGQFLEEIMQRVSLMCPLQHYGNPAYLVPSVAPFMQKGKPVEEKLRASPVASLFILFCLGFIPIGAFSRLQVKLINKCRSSLCEGVEEPKLFCNYTLLPLEFDKIKFDVYLIQLIEKIKIGVVPIDRIPHQQCLGKFAAHLKALLEDCLKEIKSDEPLFYSRLMYKFAVKCTACIQVNEKPCLRHGKYSCDHDECSHMRPLKEIEQCSSDNLRCNRSPVESLKFPLQRVKAWLYTGKEKLCTVFMQ